MHGKYAAHTVLASTITLPRLLLPLRNRAFIYLIYIADMQLTTNLPGNKKSSVLRTNRKNKLVRLRLKSDEKTHMWEHPFKKKSENMSNTVIGKISIIAQE
jgi:hypothetical protein